MIYVTSHDCCKPQFHKPYSIAIMRTKEEEMTTESRAVFFIQQVLIKCYFLIPVHIQQEKHFLTFLTKKENKLKITN